MRKSDKILIVIAITVVAFITTCFVFAWNDKVVPDELILGFFGLISAECGFLGWIKTASEKRTPPKKGGTKK